MNILSADFSVNFRKLTFKKRKYKTVIECNGQLVKGRNRRFFKRKNSASNKFEINHKV